MLSKKILAYILASTADAGIRPTLQYAYYLADKKVLVSTDSFQLHEVQWIDLWPDNLIIDSKGIQSPVPPGYRFPDYLSFFYASDPVHTFTTILSPNNIKLARDIAKAGTPYMQCILDNARIKPMPDHKYKNIEVFDFTIAIYDNKNTAPIPTLWINVDFIYNHSRYIDKPHRTTIKTKSELSPFILESTIDGFPVRTLIMPLKI